jgi:hypothetical protein
MRRSARQVRLRRDQLHANRALAEGQQARSNTMTEPAPTYDPNMPVAAPMEGEPVVEPQAAAGAWPVPPTQGQPALGTADAAAATALFALLLPQAMAGFVQYILSRSPATYQDAMIAKIAATTVP